MTATPSAVFERNSFSSSRCVKLSLNIPFIPGRQSLPASNEYTALVTFERHCWNLKRGVFTSIRCDRARVVRRRILQGEWLRPQYVRWYRWGWCDQKIPVASRRPASVCVPPIVLNIVVRKMTHRVHIVLIFQLKGGCCHAGATPLESKRRVAARIRP